MTNYHEDAELLSQSNNRLDGYFIEEYRKNIVKVGGDATVRERLDAAIVRTSVELGKRSQDKSIVGSCAEVM